MSGTGRFQRVGQQPRAQAIDWRGVEGSPEFRELVRARRRFVIPVAIVFFAIVFAYLLLAAFAHGFMGKQVGGLPMAWIIAVTQVALTWLVTWLYLRKADNTFTPLERRAAEAARSREVQR